MNGADFDPRAERVVQAAAGQIVPCGRDRVPARRYKVVLMESDQFAAVAVRVAESTSNTALVSG
jgi:hypothetical protein